MTKEYLKEHIRKLKEAEQFRFELESMYEMLKSPVITGMPGSHGEHDKIGTLISKMQEKEMRYRGKLDVILDEEKDIEKVIDALNDSRQRIVMRYRYINGLEWEEVCCKSHYSWRNTHRLHASALIKLNIQ